jgi:hypothetical protein
MTTPTDKDLRARTEAYLQTMAAEGTGLSWFAWNEFSNDVLGLLDRIEAGKTVIEEAAKAVADLKLELSATRSRLEEAQSALMDVEKTYYQEGKDATWRAAKMMGIAAQLPPTR